MRKGSCRRKEPRRQPPSSQQETGGAVGVHTDCHSGEVSSVDSFGNSRFDPRTSQIEVRENLIIAQGAVGCLRCNGGSNASTTPPPQRKKQKRQTTKNWFPLPPSPFARTCF